MTRRLEWTGLACFVDHLDVYRVLTIQPKIPKISVKYQMENLFENSWFSERNEIFGNSCTIIPILPFLGARFSKDPKTFRARKATYENAIRLFWKADLLRRLLDNKKQNNCEVRRLKTSRFLRPRGNSVGHPKKSRKVSGLTRNGLQALFRAKLILSDEGS